MKILVICQHYPPEPFRLGDLCEAMIERGHQVTVVTGTPNYPTGNLYPGYEHGARRVEMVHGVEIHHCPIHLRKPGLLHRVWNYYSFVWSSCRMVDKLAADFDVVYVHQLTPVMMAQAGVRWAKRHGKKCVLHCLDLWPESLLVGGIRKGSLIYRYFLGVSKGIYQKADRILVTSKGAISYFQDVLGMKTANIGYLPQYAENLFSNIPAKAYHEPPYHFMFAGNVGEFQSVETIVEAARLLQDNERIRIHVVGDGISLDKCRKLGEGLDNLIFHGRHPVEKMTDFYSMADVMLVTTKDLPSMEGLLPGKVQSYLAAGKPILGACRGETMHVIRDAECGLSVAAEDSRGLAECMKEMADHPDRFFQYGVNARRFYETYFDKESFMSRLEAELQEYCEEHPGKKNISEVVVG